MRFARLPKALTIYLSLLVVALAILGCDGGDDVTTTTASESTTTTTTLAEETTSTTTPPPATVEVPAVGFVTEAEGISIVEAAGLEADVTYLAAYPMEHGMVIIQDPEPGVVVAAGSTVTLTVGVDYDREPVPDVVGMTLAEATIALQDANDFVPMPTEQITANASSWGRVIEQDPTAGTELTMGGYVELTIGVAPIINPDISIPQISLPGF